MNPHESGSSEYTVLARRYRPRGFADVVGQEHVAQALKNAINKSRVAHAYLFTGARGVGKTSMARILAKSLNCPHAVNGDPCNECDICESIARGSDVDVQEIDGASNRGIDDIRQLRANVNVRSMRTRYKVYIVDEVHMLTKEAFNALLKTLEEPPPSVKFVFCTTEPNKLPDTILSRCQRFDFGTIETASILNRLQQIADSEGRQVEPAALSLVSRRAAGSMRDSQSLFDQVLAFGSDPVTAADVHRLLGTAPDERVVELFQAILNQDRGKVLEEFNSALIDGVQLGEYTDQLLSYLRDLMVLAGGASSIPLLSVSEDYRSQLGEQAKRWGLRTVVAAMQIMAETKARMQRVSYGRPLAELALIRLALLRDLESLETILQTLAQGGSLASSSAAPRQVTPPRVSSPAPEPQKKSPQTGADYSGAAPLTPSMALVKDPGTVDSVPEVAPAKLAHLWETPKELWGQIVSNIQGMLRDYARKAIDVAISGPNQLVVSFPKGYDIHRNYCETNSPTLEKALSEGAGKHVKLQFRTVEVSPNTDSAGEGETAAESKTQPTFRRNESPKDPLILKAMELFGGTPIRTE